MYLLVAALLIPWDCYLAATLPHRSVAHHYDAAWVGFDLLLIVVLARIGWLAAKRHAHVVLTAAAGATLLVVDAWFDVVTSAPGGARTQAIILALVLELPGAYLCALLARRGLATLVSRIEAPPGRRAR
jgi:hypothetical protein